MKNRKLSALVFGWTGGVGQGIVRALAKEPAFSKVTLIGRRQLDLEKFLGDNLCLQKFTQVAIDFQNVGQYKELFKNHSFAFYAIGVEGGFFFPDENLRLVEYCQAVEIGDALKSAGIVCVNWVSGQGASAYSPFYFGRVKAQTENYIRELNFQKTLIYRPGPVLTLDGAGLLGETFNSFLKFLHHYFPSISVESEKFGELVVKNGLIDFSNEHYSVIFSNRDIHDSIQEAEQYY